jgi:adenosine deaminase/aminodeoxyfutalosine deaminase
MAAELHIHLEGSIPLERFGIAREPLRDFTHFIDVYKAIVARLDSPEAYEAATRSMLESFLQQGIGYAEVTLSAGVVLWKRQDLRAVWNAIRAACLDFPDVRTAWCFDAVRHFGIEPAMRVVEIAGELREEGVVSFGIGGDEIRGAARDFDEVFAAARDRGLRLTAHAGETDGPRSIWEALRIGAERIGHGIRAIEDPELLRHLRDRAIPLEICVTSNIATGAVARLEDHPVRRLYDAGVPITLNTDDPGIFNTSLAREFEIARDHFGFSEKELDDIRANAYRFAFAPGATAAPSGI